MAQLLTHGLSGFSSGADDAVEVATSSSSAFSSSEVPNNKSRRRSTTTTKRKSIDTPHYHFIHSMLLPSTIKLQKELRGRRYRVIRLQLSEAIKEMEEFQYLMWPGDLNNNNDDDDGSSEIMPIISTSLENLEDHAFIDHNNNSSSYNNNNNIDLDTTSIDGDFSANADYDYMMDFGDDITMTTLDDSSTSSSTAGSTHNNNNKKKNDGDDDDYDDDDDDDIDYADFPAYGGKKKFLFFFFEIVVIVFNCLAFFLFSFFFFFFLSFFHLLHDTILDDPETSLKMHKSIIHALEAYILIFDHPSKTVNACNVALECISQLVFRDYISGRAGGQDDYSGSGASFSKIPKEERPTESLLHRLLTGIEKCCESNTDTVQRHVIECFTAIMGSPKCSVHKESMLVAIRSIFQIYLVSKSEDCQETAKTALMEVISHIIQLMEEYPMEVNSLYHPDSYILIKRLVYLSSKELLGVDDNNATNTTNVLGRQIFNSSTVDPKALNNKILSLELILLIMECAGEHIKTGQKFIKLVQSKLCVALLQNCISNHTQVAFTSQKIFLVLVYKFKFQLKGEIEVFMKNMFLRVLESEYSSFQQKAIVLESLRSLCEDPVLLTQIFLNYDCDFDGMNLYKDIVTNLAELAEKSTKKTTVVSKKDEEEQFELSLAAVEILVTILHTFLMTMGRGFDNHRDINDTAGKKMREALQLGGSAHEFLKKKQQEQQEEEEESSAELHKDGKTKSFTPFGSHSNLESSESNMSKEIDNLGAVIDIFDRKRNAEKSFGAGGAKFNFSVDEGLAFFVDHGFVSIDARQIATFLYQNREKLDKAQIGDVLGKEPESTFPFKKLKFPLEATSDPEKGGTGFFLRVLQHYVDLLDFSGMLFDEAIRSFLSGFRLPGEAQKIDRIMEKFATRYTQQNPDVFSASDTAFILAFSIIMLNTDLHNPSIKPNLRMTLEDFKRNNRGIGENGSDLPQEFLANIFERIKERPFSLKEDDDARNKAAIESIMKDSGGYFLERRVESHKQEQFKKEREEMMTTTEQMILRRKVTASESSGSIVDSVAPAAVAKPMFDVAFDTIVEVLSKVMVVTVDQRSISVCMNGFQYGVHIACSYKMAGARDAFVSALTKITHFETIAGINYKHTEAILLLMDLAVTDGEWFGESWGDVLRCLSHLAQMRISAPDLEENEELKMVSSNPAFLNERKSFAKRFFRNNQHSSDLQLSKEAEIMMKLGVLEDISDQVFDNVFGSTIQLSRSAMQSFTEQLLAVSIAEMDGKGVDSNLLFDMSNMNIGSSPTIDASNDDLIGDSDSSLEDVGENPRISSTTNKAGADASFYSRSLDTQTTGDDNDVLTRSSTTDKAAVARSRSFSSSSSSSSSTS